MKSRMCQAMRYATESQYDGYVFWYTWDFLGNSTPKASLLICFFKSSLITVRQSSYEFMGVGPGSMCGTLLGALQLLRYELGIKPCGILVPMGGIGRVLYATMQ
jgi:hypothetical protein